MKGKAEAGVVGEGAFPVNSFNESIDLLVSCCYCHYTARDPRIDL